MTVILLVFFIFIIITSRYKKCNEEYLSKNQTNVVKGIFIFFVFMSHFISYKVGLSNGKIDTYGVMFIKNLGQLMVTMFLFYSGYGIMESATKKGSNYINKLPTKRILKTLINFDIAVIVYMIASKYFVTHSFSIKKLVLALLGWDGFGNSNWYIFCILILYFIAYLSLKSFKDRKKILMSMIVGTILYTILLSFYKESWWYNTAFCFALGSAYSLFKPEIEKYLKGRWLISFVYILAIFIITYQLKSNFILYIINTLAFTLLIVLITRKIKTKNFILAWMGKNLFPLYIFQRLPMMLLCNMDYMKSNPYMFFGISIVLTIIITFVYNGIMFVINKSKEKITESVAERNG